MIDPRKISLNKLPLIVFSDFTSGLVEFLIKWRTKGSWNHVMWLVPGPDDRPIFASQGNVFSLAPLKRYMAKNNRLKFVSVRGLSEDQKLALINSIYEKISRPWWKKTYDWIGIAGQAFGVRWLNTPGAHFCSEDVPYHLRKIVHFLPEETGKTVSCIPGHGSPEDLNYFFKAHPEAFEIVGEWEGDREPRLTKPASRILPAFIAFLLLILSATASFGFAVRNIQDNHQFLYQVLDAAGDHVTGQTVTLKIKRVSDGYWYDFSDSTFKNTGWTNKSTNLTEDSTEGFYYYLFNPPASETAAEQYQFLVDNASATYGDHQSELVSYQSIGTSTFNSASNQVIVATNNDKTGYALSAGGVDAIWDEATSGHSTAGSYGKLITDDLNATISSRSSHSAADVATAVLVTPANKLATDGTGRVTVGSNADKAGYSISGTKTTLDALNDITSASVWAESARTITGLTAAALADLFDTNSGTTYASAVAGSVVKEIADNAGGSSLSEAGIADAVWNELLSGHTVSGSTGEKLGNIPASGTTDWTVNEKTEIKAVLGITNTGTPDNTPGSGAIYAMQGATFDSSTDSLEALRNRGDAAWITATGFSTLTAADVWAYGSRALTDKAGFSLSAAGIDAIWDEARSGHTTAGTFGYYLDAQVSAAGGGSLTAAGIADAIWDEPLSGHAVSGSAGSALTAAGVAGDPWTADVSTGYTGQAGEVLRRIDRDTNGSKDSGVYSGIETMIRANR